MLHYKQLGGVDDNRNMTEKTILVLTEMLIKEHRNKTEGKYVFTKEELIRFCIKMLKVMERNK